MRDEKIKEKKSLPTSGFADTFEKELLRTADRYLSIDRQFRSMITELRVLLYVVKYVSELMTCIKRHFPNCLWPYTWRFINPFCAILVLSALVLFRKSFIFSEKNFYRIIFISNKKNM